jgi:hypothetical protein
MLAEPEPSQHLSISNTSRGRLEVYVRYVGSQLTLSRYIISIAPRVSLTPQETFENDYIQAMCAGEPWLQYKCELLEIHQTPNHHALTPLFPIDAITFCSIVRVGSSIEGL